MKRNLNLILGYLLFMLAITFLVAGIIGVITHL